jgi:hypothetical protein
MHVCEIEQGVVEDVSLLISREITGESEMKHPRGEDIDSTDLTLVSGHRSPWAPLSHSAWLWTQAHKPLSSVQPPEVRLENPFAACANVRHSLLVA